MTALKRTPFYAAQVALKGRFVPFAGYEMAVQFAGLMAEHNAVRTAAGVFDVSHMGEVVFEGPQALDALQWIVSNDVGRLVDGTALYTVMCIANGGVVDDLIVYRESATRYFVCVNASRREDDVAHMAAQAKRFDCTVTDVSENWGQLAIQGPNADDIIAAMGDGSLRTMPAFTFCDLTLAGCAVRVARTGYTGEPGYEVYIRPADAEEFWTALMSAGAAFGLVPAGLGARDTLRLEMKYPLYGNDIDLDHTPLEAGLGWVVKLDKEFNGRDALRVQKERGVARKLVGFTMRDRGIPRQGYIIRENGKDVGVVTSGTHSPSLSEPIGVGYVPAHLAAVGSTFDVVVRDRAVPAVVVKTPFYKKEER
ncbi:MAG: glycine cleavage system aminomethyltransferase GcvT [Clostridia bacterium]|nr:glycine cleavage system aminomethyltransferase GcvT [Deltaproteobacteria bacterium]